MSKFKLYCIGTVAEPKSSLSTSIIQVTLDEVHPLEDGDKISSEERYTTYGKDRKGNPYSSEISVDKTVDAVWIRHGNRVSAPDVVRGEKVEIWRYDNDDAFYWKEVGVGSAFKRRQKETVVMAVSASNDSEKNDHTSDNCYSFTISGHGKKVILNMPVASDELAAMSAMFDGENGLIEFKMEGVGSIRIKHNKQVTLSTVEGAVIDLNGKDIAMDFDKLTLKGNKIDIKSSKADVTIGTSNWKGAINHTGTLNNTGKIKSNEVSLDQHKHPANNTPPIPGT